MLPAATPKPTATVTRLPPLSGSGGRRVVFSSKRDDNYEIYVTLAPHASAGVNADDTGQQQLTRNLREDRHPVWSPDGPQIAFESDHSGRFDTYVMNVADALQGTDGSNVRRLTTQGDNGYPTWSPDGAWIASSRYAPGSDIYVVNADGANQQRLTQTGVGGVDMDIFDPDWSPDGTQIACVLDSNSAPSERVGDLCAECPGYSSRRLRSSAGAAPARQAIE
jgi:Tol biopolymer transport system component